jgi:hypothetical protein
MLAEQRVTHEQQHDCLPASPAPLHTTACVSLTLTLSMLAMRFTKSGAWSGMVNVTLRTPSCQGVT